MLRVIRFVLRIAGMVVAIAAILATAAFVAIRQPSIPRRRSAPRDHASASRVRRDVVTLATAFSSRSADHPETLAAAADFIAGEFAATGARVARQRFSVRGRNYENVIASLGQGTEPSLIIGAHYDAFSLKTALPAADDNASGTAALLELARILRNSPPVRRVDLVAYANEEPPFFGSDGMGSAIHAASLATRPPMISLEMIGYFTAKEPQTNSLLDRLYPSTGDFVVVAGRWSDRSLSRRIRNAMNEAMPHHVDAFSLVVPRTLGIDASDQRCYWDRGYRAVMITDTAYVRNPHYHTSLDSPETLDYERLATVVDGVASVARSRSRM